LRERADCNRVATDDDISGYTILYRHQQRQYFLHTAPDESLLSEIGKRLARVRIEAGVTQGGLAEKAGVGNYQPAGEWTSSHQMTLNGKRDGFRIEDFRECARTASLKRGRAGVIANKIREVAKRWRDYADEAGVPPRQRDKIQSALRLGSFG